MITNEQKAEKAYKKSVQGVATTANDKAYNAEPNSPRTVRAQHVWAQDNLIPTIKPTPVANRIYDKDGLNVEDTGAEGIIEYKEVQMEQVIGASDSFIIPGSEHKALNYNEYDGLYAPEFWDMNANTQIPFGLNGMEWDAEAGVLWFIGGKPSTLY